MWSQSDQRNGSVEKPKFSRPLENGIKEIAMSITKILTRKDADPEVQVTEVADVVAVARAAYGNEGETIDAPMVDTPHGRMSFVHLEAASQVETLRGTVASIKAQAVEFLETNPGANLNKKVEELLAINAYFANVGSGTKFEYI
jgi:hypothetical protein